MPKKCPDLFFSTQNFFIRIFREMLIFQFFNKYFVKKLLISKIFSKASLVLTTFWTPRREWVSSDVVKRALCDDLWVKGKSCGASSNEQQRAHVIASLRLQMALLVSLEHSTGVSSELVSDRCLKMWSRRDEERSVLVIVCVRVMQLAVK